MLAFFDLLVGINESQTKQMCDLGADACLAGARHADEHGDRAVGRAQPRHVHDGHVVPPGAGRALLAASTARRSEA